MPVENLIIGFDVGTTSIKGAVFDGEGAAIASFAEAYSKSHPHENWVEQDPDHWLAMIKSALSAFEKEIDLSQVASICVCSQVNTHIPVDETGAALRPAIVWQDTRAGAVAAELDASFSPEEKIDIWGGEFVVDSSFSLSRAVWLSRHEPEIWAKTRWLMSPKDFCNFALCGSAASDPISSVGLVGPGGEYVQGLEPRLSGFMERLPPLKGIFDVVGRTKIKEFPALDAPVVNGTMDAWANMFGSGVVSPGQAMLIGGTSSIIGVLSSQSVPTKGVISFPEFDSWHLHAGPTQAGSDAFAWIAKMFGREIDAFLKEIESNEIQPFSLLFLPHLQGERAPLWDANARGVFVGLTAQHGPRDMALAVIEGVAYSERHLFEECAKAAGFTPDAVRLSGGSSVNDKWSQLRADIVGSMLERTRITHTGVMGAAMIGGVGSAAFSDLREAADRLVKIDRQFKPNPKNKAKFDRRYALYRDSYRQLKPIFDRLAETADEGAQGS